MNLKYKNDSKFNTYIPLHGHSTYSIGDGVAKIEDIISKVKEIGADAVAITEHGNMSSFLKFYKEANYKGVKPILGCELYLNDLFYNNKEEFLEKRRSKKKNEDDDSEEDYGGKAENNHFLVYSTNYQGLKNIISISNIGSTNFYRKPLINSELIFQKLDKNNIVTTGCLQSEFNQLILRDEYAAIESLLKKYKEKFENNFYLEVQLNHLKEQKKIVEFYQNNYRRLDIKPVFALDYHYINKEDWEIQYLLYLIKQRNDIETVPQEKWFYNVRDLYIKDIDEIYKYSEKLGIDKNFLELSIDSTFEIRDKVDIKIPVYPDNFPIYIEDHSECEKIFFEKLRSSFKDKIHSGLIPKDKVQIYFDRLEEEIKVIKKKNMIDYFMIIDDIIKFVYSEGGNIGAGRGSAAGSLVLFVLDLTKIDPIKHNLIFERFMNLERKDPTDLDLDVSSEHQKQVEDYLKERYGEDKVCHIANFGKFGAKTIIKDLCRIYKLDYNMSNKLTSYFDTIKSDLPINEQLESTKKIAKVQNEHQLIKFIDDNKRLFIEKGLKFMNMVRSSGKHASGILVSNKNFFESEIPVIRHKDEIVTGFQEGGDDREVSELGFCKLDILGLQTASVNNNTLKKVEEKYGIKDLENKLLISELDDENVYREFCKGNSRDIFQFGSDNMIALIKNVQPNCIEDLCSINSLFRPAVINSGAIDVYLENKKNKEKTKEEITNKHPDLWDILSQTHGTVIYQEQLMFILQKIGGFTLAESDQARKIMKLLHKGNQEKTEAFFEMLEKFKRNARENGLNEKDLEWLLDILGKYSEYCFNRCLHGNTEVLTKDGCKKIKFIKKDDIIYSYDLNMNKVVETKVVEKYKNGKRKVYSICDVDGNKVVCTMNHKFLCEDRLMHSLSTIIEKDLCIVDSSNSATKFNKDSLRKIGYRNTYDIEVDNENHNFILNNRLISSNSHSLAYSINAYISMYLKVYYTKEYFSELLNYCNESEIGWFIKEAKNFGINFNDFKVNKVDHRFSVDYDNNSLSYGLNLVKGLSKNDYNKVLKIEVNDVYELIDHVIKNKVSKRSYEPLCRLDYFSEYFKNSKLLEFLINGCRRIKKSETLKEKVDLLISQNVIEDYTLKEKLEFQKKYLNIFVSKHPFLEFDEFVREHREVKLIMKDSLYSPKNVYNINEDRQFIVYGIVNDILTKKSKKSGREYYKLVLEDDEQQIQITLFDARDIIEIKKMDKIVIKVDKNNFGFTKQHKTKIITIEE